MGDVFDDLDIKVDVLGLMKSMEHPDDLAFFDNWSQKWLDHVSGVKVLDEVKDDSDPGLQRLPRPCPQDPPGPSRPALEDASACAPDAIREQMMTMSLWVEPK